mmetsp:Transcript_19728/g.34749  ORF Transcript_19728/g.34749 Transcript_19728/m.34749 type:complete len:359 (+) Transcript_19728:77-1153(+)
MSSEREMISVVIAGAAGSVGRGILEAFISFSSHRRTKETWSVIAIDPAFSLEIDNHIDFFACTIEDVSDDVFQSWFDKSDRVEFIYAAEDGNRDNYANRPNLGEQNDVRFATFIRRAVVASGRARQMRPVQRPMLHVSYVGGSWTRREAIRGVVSDESPAKMGGGDNPYERAKTNAEEHARALARDHAVDITFLDYISVAPNFAPNFSVNRMAVSAFRDGIIRYSPGDYGRPLLHSKQAGDLIVSLVKIRIQRDGHRIYFQGGGSFQSLVVPGQFVSFHQFATIANEAVLSRLDTDDHMGERVRLEEMDSEQTPEQLKTHCSSKTLITAVGFVPDKTMVEAGLRESALFAINQVIGKG